MINLHISIRINSEVNCQKIVKKKKVEQSLIYFNSR